MVSKEQIIKLAHLMDTQNVGTSSENEGKLLLKTYF